MITLIQPTMYEIHRYNHHGQAHIRLEARMPSMEYQISTKCFYDGETKWGAYEGKPFPMPDSPKVKIPSSLWVSVKPDDWVMLIIAAENVSKKKTHLLIDEKKVLEHLIIRIPHLVSGAGFDLEKNITLFYKENGKPKLPAGKQKLL
jgi:hypothetical protein